MNDWEFDSVFWKLRKYDKHIHLYIMYMWWNTISLIVTLSLPFYLLYLDDAYDGSDTPPHKHTSTRFSVLFLSVRPRYSNLLFLSFFIHLFRGWRFWISEKVHRSIRGQGIELFIFIIFLSIFGKKNQRRWSPFCTFSAGEVMSVYEYMREIRTIILYKRALVFRFIEYHSISWENSTWENKAQRKDGLFS